MNAAINAHELNWVELTSVELVEMSLNRIETYSEQGRSIKEKRPFTGRFPLSLMRYINQLRGGACRSFRTESILREPPAVGGNSLNVARNFCTAACAGTNVHI